MSINKFGSHMFGQKTLNGGEKDINTFNVVDINKINLYYHLALPFIASWNDSKNIYMLGQDNKEKYVFPFKVGIIESLEFPNEVTVFVNKNLAKVGVQLKKGDEIYFKKNTNTIKFVNILYGAILLKCAVEIESSQK
jgi:hypothetical protein